jgi:hypothetical protein
MNKQEFNEAMARLKYPEALGYLKDQKERDAWLKGHIAVNDYYNDLNLLMPLAWKHKITVEPDTDETWFADEILDSDGICICHEDPIQAIRDCLWSLTHREE